MNIRNLVAAALIVMTPSLGTAASWEVDVSASEVNFDYVKDGAPTSGTFGTFSGTGKLDPDMPASAELTIKIDTRSIDLYDRMASLYATSAEWFDSKNHRFITYRLTKLTPRTDRQYDAQGMLSVRGVDMPVASVITLDFDGENASATGLLKLDRSDYFLGFGPSTALVDIGPEVAVRFDLRARRTN